jgi:hypothetical protein
MTTIPALLRTTTQIRRGERIQLSISYDFTCLGTEIAAVKNFQSLIDQAITQWWNSLTPVQRSGALARPMSLLISARYRE